MDEERKYRQRGYMDGSGSAGDGAREERPKSQGPRPPLDVTGPRLPRLVQSIVASRCYNCSLALPSGMDFKAACPKCGAALHCCKQCTNFEPSTRFQCLKPIPARLAYKDAANECELFAPRVTVARDVAPASAAAIAQRVVESKKPSDARAAFDSLFKK
ncbi:MAG: hypothetical protein HY822_16735 [Acidobacteria bacterium]|nr:hypothetical protein [Acidobacteriota bacterium]